MNRITSYTMEHLVEVARRLRDGIGLTKPTGSGASTATGRRANDANRIRRSAARSLLAQRVEPARVSFDDGSTGPSLLPATDLPATEERIEDDGGCSTDASPADFDLSVPQAFLEPARLVACHRDAGRWNLLYRISWRLTRGGERRLLEIPVDDDVSRLDAMQKAVRRDRHKMTAFVRFRCVDSLPASLAKVDVAWHQPDHYIGA